MPVRFGNFPFEFRAYATGSPFTRPGPYRSSVLSTAKGLFGKML